MITLKDICKKVGGRLLFEDVTVTFNAGNRYGLTGPNGAGKSTLLKIIMGQIEADAGSISLPSKVAFLRQDIEAFHHLKVLDIVIMGNKRLWAAYEERDTLYTVPFTEKIGLRLGALEEIIEEENGYCAEAEAEQLLINTGIDATLHQQTLGAIPSDKQFKVLLCQSLFSPAGALILDEPTNHLDLEAIGWLEQFLLSYKGVLIVVSHDRHFLNSVTTHIADIDYETIIVYPGNYDNMVEAKSSVRERVEADNRVKAKKVAQLREFVSKFSAGTRASQVQSRLREISKMEPQELKSTNIQRPYVRFRNPEKVSSHTVFKSKNATCGYHDRPVFSKFSYEISKGARIGLIGNNGLGKTTCLKALAGLLPCMDGSITQGSNVRIGYFPQNHGDILDRSSNDTVFEWLLARKGVGTDQEVRNVLGKLLFSGADAMKPLKALSGGETARAILAFLMLNDINVLLLDEPNNHLDLEAVSALREALQKFPGTVVLASHDRDLLNGVVETLLVFHQGTIKPFEGNLEQYLSKHGQRS